MGQAQNLGGVKMVPGAQYQRLVLRLSQLSLASSSSFRACGQKGTFVTLCVTTKGKGTAYFFWKGEEGEHQ